MPIIYRFLETFMIVIHLIYFCSEWILFILICIFHVKGMAQFVCNFAEKGDPEYQPPVPKGETPVRLPLLHKTYSF